MTGVVKGEKLYEGKAKVVYATSDPDLLVIEYKDDATAFDGKKRGTIAGKGACNNRISAILFEALARAGIKSHFVRLLSDRESLVRRVRIIPVEVVVRNVAAGSLARRLGLAEGTPLASTVVELYYKRDDLGDPFINHYHVRALGLATEAQVAEMERQALAINEVLRPLLYEKGLNLIDFKLEFGLAGGEVLLADEISPDTCRLWDVGTGERLDKDRFRRDLGGEEEAYAEVLRRLQS